MTNRKYNEAKPYGTHAVHIRWYLYKYFQQPSWGRVWDNSVIGPAWWRQKMESFSALLAPCAGNSPMTGEFPSQRPVTRSFHVLFDLCLNKRLSKQSWAWWFETPSRPLWRQRNEITAPNLYINHWCVVANLTPRHKLQLNWNPNHDDVIKWKHFLRNCPSVRGIHRSPVNSPHKGQWRGALMFSLICAWTNGWANNEEAGSWWFETLSCSLWRHCNVLCFSLKEINLKISSAKSTILSRLQCDITNIYWHTK